MKLTKILYNISRKFGKTATILNDIEIVASLDAKKIKKRIVRKAVNKAANKINKKI